MAEQLVQVVADEQTLQFDGQAVQFGTVEMYPGAHKTQLVVVVKL